MAVSGDEFTGWGNRLLDLVDRAYRILRGIPHNRNATIVIVAGVLILAGPFWEPYLRAAALKWLGLRVDLPTDPIFGILLVTLGLLYHFAMTWLAGREADRLALLQVQGDERIRAHDAPIFADFMSKSPEMPVRNALENMRDSHSYFSTQRDVLLAAYYFLDTATNRFNDIEVAAAANALKSALASLSDFTDTNFFVHGPMRENNMFAMHPQWNIDRGGYPNDAQERTYRELGRELVRLSREAEAAYLAVVETAHRRIL